MKLKHCMSTLLLAGLPVSSQALNLAQDPLFIASTEPRIMLVASRDHQLSIKAYTDYSDLDGDGTLDTTYKDTITYYGYFDSKKCYTYSTSNNRFEPSAAVNTGTHQCNGSTWSGNFLNWATMTRMDILRKVFYGGYRSTDTAGASGETVLERHFLPVDVHAFVKVYTPTGSMPSIQSLTGISGQTSISLCNVSDSTNTNLTGTSSFTIPSPSIKVASGAWPQWDSSEVTQCAVNIGNSTQPTSLLTTVGSSGVLTARVQVCASGMLESNCKTYTNPSNGVQTVKPIGLLQQYGDVDADRRVRFGLMTGSYARNKSGGVLRKNTSLLSNNNKAAINSSTNCSTANSATTVNGNANDEINVCTGQFIRQNATDGGIINTLNRLRIAGFKYTSAGRNDSHRYSCNSPGITSFSNGECVDWGNPLSEVYLEALRYFANAGVTSGFNANDASILASLPQVTWSDPLPASEWCALSSIVVLSTGLNSFDTDELTAFTPSGGATAINAADLTQTVGNLEGINGGIYLIGDNGSVANNQCTAKTVSNLATAKGVCPEVPSLQGGYGIAGLAYAPKTIDLRPGYASNRQSRWGGANPVNPDWAARQPINTYAVQLAESLPSFSTPVGSGSVTLLPACQANSTAGAAAWPGSTGWRNCSMTNLIVDTNVAMASVGSDATAKTNTCSGNGTTSQCFTVAWEDSTWGNDYDMDGIQRLGYCVGSACSSFKMLCPNTTSATATLGPWTVGANEIVIATCTAQAQAGHALTFGYTVTGTTNDGAFFPILRPGGANFNVGSTMHASVTPPHAATFIQGSSTASLLKNPLWYAAKYGGFTESTPTAGTPEPDLTSEWDALINATGTAGSDGIPDNYFDVKNPANLISAMASIFDAASQPDASAASVATNSTNLRIESRIYQARFSSADWSGQLLQYKINTAGVIAATPEWDAGALLQSASGRTILTKGSSDGVAFQWGNLTSAQQTALNTNAQGTNDGLGSNRVSYLRGTDATGFRPRPVSKLGDIVNSNPWYVAKPDAGYSDVDHPGYSAFRTAHASRKPVVYVGGNDGMLHGFDASLDFSTNSAGVPTATSGKEVLAYVPSAVYANLSRLSATNYNKNHRYFVDGSPMIADIDLDSSAASDWRTVLIGGLGAGGKGYYALDVTNPANFSESGTAPADILLWEFDETDMGFTFNHPPAHLRTNQAKQIVKLANGKWAAVLGNGYNSTNGKAVLYVVYIEDGVDGTWSVGDFVKIVADAGPDNGLSTPVPFDSNGDGYADTVYAGDLKGNLWKFLIGPNASDASVTSNPSTWKIAFSTNAWNAGTATLSCTTCTPLFVARNASNQIQPITWPPEVTLHPYGGVMVLFGTGKYLESGDNTSTQVQSFYGIWDWHNGVYHNLSRTDLRQQTVTVSTLNGRNYRTPSTNTVSWRGFSCVPPYAGSCNVGSHMGWYMDLPTSGERLTGIPKLEAGTIFFNTFIPSTSPCDAGGTGWLMTLDYLSGGLLTFPMFDTNNDGVIDASDTIVGGLQIGAALGGTTLIQGVGAGTTGVGVSSLTSGSMTTTLISFGPTSRGRISWREITQ